MGWGGGRFKREGIHVHLWLTYADVWQKATQYCQASVFHLEKKKSSLRYTEQQGQVSASQIDFRVILITLSPQKNIVCMWLCLLSQLVLFLEGETINKHLLRTYQRQSL